VPSTHRLVRWSPLHRPGLVQWDTIRWPLGVQRGHGSRSSLNSTEYASRPCRFSEAQFEGSTEFGDTHFAGFVWFGSVRLAGQEGFDWAGSRAWLDALDEISGCASSACPRRLGRGVSTDQSNPAEEGEWGKLVH
jgi:hypothetical protein